MGNYKELEVWKESISIAKRVYEITSEGKISKDFALRDQMRRATVSVGSNISEGEAGGGDRIFVRHLKITRGSLAELETQLIIAVEIGYFSMESVLLLFDDIDKTSRKISRLINYRSESFQ